MVCANSNFFPLKSFVSVGQLGNPSISNSSNVPVPVYTGNFLNGKIIKKVVAKGRFTIALSTEGKLYSWGENVCICFRKLLIFTFYHHVRIMVNWVLVTQ